VRQTLNSAAVLSLALAILPCAAMAQDSDGDWRALDPQNTLVLEIQKAPASQAELLRPQTSTVVIEMAPDFAPNHVARMKALARQGFYDGRTFHRVIENFMAQAGGIPGDPTGGDSPLPNLQSEFVLRAGPDVVPVKAQDARQLDPRRGNSPVTEAGFLDGFPVAYQPAAQAMVSADGKRDVWIAHCPGTAAAARTSDPNSANFQFYLTRGEAAWLDSQYTAWGQVRAGMDGVMGLKVGEPVVQPDTIRRLRVAADLPEAERPQIEVMRTDSAAFAQIIADARAAAGGDINVCDIPVPTRAAQ
jgi:peptidylprolyl isomerase